MYRGLGERTRTSASSMWLNFGSLRLVEMMVNILFSEDTSCSNFERFSFRPGDWGVCVGVCVGAVEGEGCVCWGTEGGGARDLQRYEERT